MMFVRLLCILYTTVHCKGNFCAKIVLDSFELSTCTMYINVCIVLPVDEPCACIYMYVSSRYFIFCVSTIVFSVGF